jgi:hypothetical protein
MYVVCIGLLLFPHESIYWQNAFVCFKFYIYTNGIVVFMWLAWPCYNLDIKNKRSSNVTYPNLGGRGCYNLVSDSGTLKIPRLNHIVTKASKHIYKGTLAQNIPYHHPINHMYIYNSGSSLGYYIIPLANFLQKRD